MSEPLIDSREHPAIQCRTCGVIVWTQNASRHLAEEHPELPDPAQIRMDELRSEA